MIWEIVVYSPPPAVPSRSYIIVQTRDSSSTPWFIRRPNPVFLKDIPVRRFFQRLFKSDNVMFYTSYSFDFIKAILWPKYNYLITLTGVLYKLNFALKVSSNFLFQKKWNFSTLVAFQVRLLSRETTGTRYPVVLLYRYRSTGYRSTVQYNYCYCRCRLSCICRLYRLPGRAASGSGTIKQ